MNDAKAVLRSANKTEQISGPLYCEARPSRCSVVSRRVPPVAEQETGRKPFCCSEDAPNSGRADNYSEHAWSALAFDVAQERAQLRSGLHRVTLTDETWRFNWYSYFI